MRTAESVSETELFAIEALQRCGQKPLSSISCKCFDGTVFLTGEVPSYHMKQLAQEIIRNVDGIGRIVNRLDVSPVQAVEKS